MSISFLKDLAAMYKDSDRLLLRIALTNACPIMVLLVPSSIISGLSGTTVLLTRPGDDIVCTIVDNIDMITNNKISEVEDNFL